MNYLPMNCYLIVLGKHGKRIGDVIELPSGGGICTKTHKQYTREELADYKDKLDNVIKLKK